MPENSAPPAADAHALLGWHAAQHTHEGNEHHGEEDAPLGIVVEFPPLLAPSLGPASANAPLSQLVAVAMTTRAWYLAVVDSTHRPELCKSGWPPERGERSGIAALFRFGHAILI